MAQIQLKCSDLSFSRGDRSIIHQFNLELVTGDVGVLQGNNGSGKTTLIKMLSGIIKANSGSIFYDNEPISASEAYLQQLLYIGIGELWRKQPSILNNP